MKKLTLAMKQWISLSLLVVMSFALVACQSGNGAQEKAEDQSVLSGYLDELKAGEFETASKRLESVPDNFNYSDNEVMKHFFAKMTYTIKETKETTEGMEAVVVIKLPNTAVIYDSMMGDIGDEVQKLQGGNDDAKTKAFNMMIDFMLQKIDDPNVVMVENTVTVSLKKVDSKMVIVPDNSLSKALSGLSSDKK